MKRRPWGWNGTVLVFAGALLFALVIPRLQRGTSQEAKPAARQIVPETRTLIGTATCSARGCHGSIEPRHGKTCEQNEYSLWVNDSHANAYQLLFDERSQKIAALLNGDKGPKAHEDGRCLACHTNPLVNTLPKTSSLAKEERLFGVGCESCHEGANHWLVSHTTDKWAHFKPNEKKAQHMKDLTNPAVQASMCAGCHVGAPPIEKGLPPRDVNHDLIAAGHPRLQFEFGAYQANMPLHWNPKKRPEVHFWAVGQLASAQAALELLDHRTREGPWPEFAEFNCFSCHHDLAAPSWRQQAERGKRPLSSPSWGSWYFALPPSLGELPALGELEKIMQARHPHREQARLQAGKVAEELKKFAGRTAEKDEDMAFRQQIIKELVAKTGTPRFASWDSAEQIYLALHALNDHPKKSEIADVLRQLKPMHITPEKFFPKDFLDKVRPLAPKLGGN